MDEVGPSNQFTVLGRLVKPGHTVVTKWILGISAPEDGSITNDGFRLSWPAH